MPATSTTVALGAMPQELAGPSSNRQQNFSSKPAPDLDDEKSPTDDPLDSAVEDVEVKRLDDEPEQEPVEADPIQESFSDVKKDKWALSNEDRMTNDEMNKELFGDDDEVDLEGRLDTSKLSSKRDESDIATQNDRDGDLKRDEKTEKLAARQTIESYLKGISSLNIDTNTPTSTSREGIDVPISIMPPITSTAKRNYPVTGIRYQTPDIYHNPLYFEDRAAERAGVIKGLRQPIVSARKFAVDAFALPRKIHRARPRSCEYHQNLRYSQPSLIRN